MTNVTASPRDISFADSFSTNEFDIAGLADVPDDEIVVDCSLRELNSILKHHEEPTRLDSGRLSRVLLGMMAVARDDYAGSGYAEYWPFLFDRIHKAVFADPKLFASSYGDQQDQALLGQWFHKALDEFGYSIPDDYRRYVGPIVFHAGIPSASLPGVIQVIVTACEHYGSNALNLPFDLRHALVKSQNPPLHQSVERLLTSKLRGAAQLWNCLARVLIAWQEGRDFSDELSQLPQVIDPEEVRLALPTSVSLTRRARTPLPQLRFDAETGEVRLWIQADAVSRWSVFAGRTKLDLRWTTTHLGQTADFLKPLPEEITVKAEGSEFETSRTFATKPSHWPGFWFHARNGNIEDGQTIDASGIEAGRWYVLFEGTPTRWSVKPIGGVQLKWKWFEGHGAWTAWEIEVPPRTPDQSHLKCYVDDNCFEVPLARRPGPRVECVESPIITATTDLGESISVFSQAPAVIHRRELSLSTMLLRQNADGVTIIQRLELAPERPVQLPIAKPGIYQLRESKGVGRTLLHFAVLPGLKVSDPTYDAGRTRVSVEMSADVGVGSFTSVSGHIQELSTEPWHFESSTVEPFLRGELRWNDEESPPLNLRWAVQGLRWRVTGMSEELARWTREAVFVNPDDVAKTDAQLEIQIPQTTNLFVNGVDCSDQFQKGPSGDTLIRSLLAYKDLVEIAHGTERFAVVVLAKRPLVSSLQAASDEATVLVSWKAESLPSGTVLAAWNPLDPLKEPKTFKLSQDELQRGEWQGDFAALPGDGCTSITLARSAGGFFKSVLHLAARKSDPSEPLAILLQRSTSEAVSVEGRPGSWPQLLHLLTVKRLCGISIDPEFIAKDLEQINRSGNECLLGVTAFAEQLRGRLDGDQNVKEADRDWSHKVLAGISASVTGLDHEETLCSNERLLAPLRIGFSIGQTCPTEWFPKIQPLADQPAYPLGYIRDLWLLAVSPSEFLRHPLGKAGRLPSDPGTRQSAAAQRVVDFHRHWELPWPAKFLPLARSTAFTVSTDKCHKHSFAIPPHAIGRETVDDFQALLGLDDKAIDCQATFDDCNYRGQLQYSLYWCGRENSWAIEPYTKATSIQTCCSTGTLPLFVDPWPPLELSKRLNVRELLMCWGKQHSNSKKDGPTKSFERIARQVQQVLFDDIVTGLLHQDIVIPPKSQTKKLWGKEDVVITSQPRPPECAVIAWQLAWIERLCAWHGPETFFDSRTGAESRIEFCVALGDALSQWPDLMCRCIALAESLYWVFYREGLGLAARFREQAKPASSVQTFRSRPR